MAHQGTDQFLLYFWRSYPRRTLVLVILLALSGLSEALGVATIVPLLEVAVQSGDGSSGLSRMVSKVVGFVGLSPTLGVLLALVTVGMALKGVFRLLAMKQVGKTVANVSTDLRLQLIDALLRTRWGYFASQQSGRFGNAITTEATRAASSYRALCALIASGIQTLAYLALAMVVSWQVALIAVAAGGVIVLLLNRLVRMSRDAGERHTHYMRALVSRLTDSLQGIKPIKAMGQEQRLQPLLIHETRGINTAMERGVLASESTMAAQEPILVAFMAAGLYAALTYGSIPLTELLVMAFLFHRLAGRISILQSDYQTLVNGESAFWSLQHSIASAVEMREIHTGQVPVVHLQRGIRLDHVSFSYNETRVLNAVSLDIPVGELVVLAGPSGAGKTTMADLIVGLHTPDSGEIYLDDTPLSNVRMSEWRASIGYVPQEMFLFHDTLMANVAMGDPAVGREAVEEALRQAGAWDFVETFSHGLDTIMGERGSRVSGGQRQRIAIARALARRPQLLVLDEITASLDPETEIQLCDTLRSLRGTVTMLAISHQPALKAVADRVYWVDQGQARRIVDDNFADKALAAAR